jgi:hypothetical protein
MMDKATKRRRKRLVTRIKEFERLLDMATNEDERAIDERTLQLLRNLLKQGDDSETKLRKRES